MALDGRSIIVSAVFDLCHGERIAVSLQRDRPQPDEVNASPAVSQQGTVHEVNASPVVSRQGTVHTNILSSFEHPEGKPNELSPASLAYLGDAVYELYVRNYFLFPPRRIAQYHQLVVARVRAESQAECLQTLKPHLTETEQEIVRRGRNAASKSRRRLPPEIYQQATSFETLLGYLYLQDPQRLNQLLKQLDH